MSKNCAICGKPLDGGMVVHPDCVPRWIPVTERLPERYQTVIVCRPYDAETMKVEQGYRDDGGWWKVFGTRTKKVTHWMRMPKPPEEMQG